MNLKLGYTGRQGWRVPKKDSNEPLANTMKSVIYLMCLLFLLCSRPSVELTMRLHEMPPLPSVLRQFRRCFNVYTF